MAFRWQLGSATIGLIAIVCSTIGCQANECASANEHLADCLGAPEAPGAKDSNATTCEGDPACIATCINGAECSALKDLYSTKPTDTSKVLLDCYTKCQAP